jgi:hypothetical protein
MNFVGDLAGVGLVVGAGSCFVCKLAGNPGIVAIPGCHTRTQCVAGDQVIAPDA